MELATSYRLFFKIRDLFYILHHMNLRRFYFNILYTNHSAFSKCMIYKLIGNNDMSHDDRIYIVHLRMLYKISCQQRHIDGNFNILYIL